MIDYGDAILTVLDSTGGKLVGRTAIQKLLYFASQKGFLKDTYLPHYYGPYSLETSDSLLELCSLDFVDEELERSTTPGRDWRRYSYILTKRGEEYLNFIGEGLGTESTKLAKLVQKASELTKLEVEPLSCAAKVHYLVKTSPHVSEDSIRKLAGDFGWNLSKEQINRAIALLAELKLVEVVQE